MESIAHQALSAVLATPEVGDCEVQGVWLFGSYAREEYHAGSDIDLALLCVPGLGLERAAVRDHASRAVGIEVDVVDLTTAPATLAWEVITTGRLVLERDESAVMAFVRATRFRAEDEAKRNRMVMLTQSAETRGESR